MSETMKAPTETDYRVASSLLDYVERDYPHAVPPLREYIDQLRAHIARLATPASAPVGETTDTERLDFIEAEDAQITQWERDLNGDVSETLWEVGTVNGGFSRRDLRQAIDAARAAERRDQEEGR